MASTTTPYQPSIESVTEFLQRLKVQQSAFANAETTNSEKAAILIRALPVNVITDIQRRIKPTQLTDATFAELEASLISQYEVKKSIIGASVKFINRKQLQDESIETYAKVLNELASHCNYSPCCLSRLLRDTFVSGLRSTEIIAKMLLEPEDQNFKDSVQRAKLLEQLTSDAIDITRKDVFNTEEVFKVGNYNNKKKIPSNENYKCIRCGAVKKHFASDCPAINLRCKKCNKFGHFARACRQTTNYVSDSTPYFSSEQESTNEASAARYQECSSTNQRQDAQSRDGAYYHPDTASNQRREQPSRDYLDSRSNVFHSELSYSRVQDEDNSPFLW